jgi:chemotaxis protein methyltransferase CheR
MMLASGIPLGDREFDAIRSLMYQRAGVSIAREKRALVSGRLEKRLRVLGMGGYADYLRLVGSPEGADELRITIDSLTTNETYFFREPAHFDFLRDQVAARDRPGRRWRVWSAASSSGEEAYSIAMTLASTLGSDRWEVFGSDISTRVLETARRAVYPVARLEQFPRDLLKRYCLKGTGPESGKLLVDRAIRARVSFAQINLNEDLPDVGPFDFVFLRNALIYFDVDKKREIIARVGRALSPGGHFIVSHSESLHGLASGLEQVRPSIHRRPE